MPSPPRTSASPPAAAGDLARADVGLVCALARELAPLWPKCRSVRKYSGGEFTFRGGRLRDLRIAAVETGAGLHRARRGTQALLDAHHPDWIISVGLSGSLVPEIRIGDVILASSLQTPDGPALSLDLKCDPDPSRGLHVGKLVSAPAIVRTVAEKQQLHAATGCAAVDMESFAVADLCRQQQVRFLAVRGVSDDLSADLPLEALTIFGSTGFLRLGAAAGSLWRRPSSWNDLWKLHEQAQRAAAAMVDTLIGLLPLLAGSTPRA